MPEKRWPKHRYRWRRAALEALRTTGSFTMAAAACGVSRRSLFRLRQADPRFEAEVENALDAYCDHLEELVDQRAFHGADDNIYQHGILVGTRKIYSDRLAEMRLRALRPEQYGDRKADSAGRATFVVNLGIRKPDDNPTPMAARWEPSGGSPEGLTPARGKGEGDPGAGPRRS